MENSYLDQIRAQLAEDQEFLEDLQSGKLHYGHPSDAEALTHRRVQHMIQQITREWDK